MLDTARPSEHVILAMAGDKGLSDSASHRCVPSRPEAHLQGGRHGAVHEQHGIMRNLVFQVQAARVCQSGAHQLPAALQVGEAHVLHPTKASELGWGRSGWQMEHLRRCMQMLQDTAPPKCALRRMQMEICWAYYRIPSPSCMN